MNNSKSIFQKVKNFSFSICLSTFVVWAGSVNAQAPESCDCVVDTAGYANFITTLVPDENATFQFHPHNTFAVAYGVIGPSTPSVVQSLIDNHPNVTTIVMYACPGSMDDDANLEVSLLLHQQGYKMYLPFNGWIASGATDMFMGGSIRVMEVTPDAVGVHAWGDGGSIEATDFPVGHANHQPYIDYYVSVGLTQQESEDFYYFTINAAPSNGIHWMTQSELDQYKVRSCTYAATPDYQVVQIGNTLNAGVSGASYQWLDCDDNSSPIAGETGQSFSPATSGNYAVEITESNCSGATDCFAFAPSSITDNGESGSLSVFPNPSLGAVTMTLTGVHGGERVVEIYNALGLLIDSYSAPVRSSTISLDLSDHEAGVYFLKVEEYKAVKVLIGR